VFHIDKNDFSLPLEKECIRFDCAFIAIHGNPGVDGKLQGYFDMLGIPYVGCDAAVSSLTFNKNILIVLKTYGIHMPMPTIFTHTLISIMKS
jgi:D-alanine-D-alanine ligase-like ATP-grasp enzyme